MMTNQKKNKSASSVPPTPLLRRAGERRASTKNQDKEPSQLAARSSELCFVFFGAGPIAVGALNEMERHEMLPVLVVTSPDKPTGRGKTLTPSLVAQWASERSVDTLKPENL